jgi:hypothetical protein
MCPALRAYIPDHARNFGELKDAAHRVAAEMGISQHAWARACASLSVAVAIVCVVVTAARNEEDIRFTKAHYFMGMLKRGERGELDLERSIRYLRFRLKAAA